MRWTGGRRSDNIEDRRGQRVSRGVAVGGIGGIGTLLVLVVGWLMGIDPFTLLQQTGESTSVDDGRTYGEESTPVSESPEERQLRDFVSVVVGDTEDTWGAIFKQSGQSYRPPTLVLFRDAVRSACGIAESAVGPFYCPADGKVYLDLSFMNELDRRFGAPGDFAQAYVIAHEVGHHVQNLLGLADQVQAARSRLDQQDANALSVRFELQADCLAGVWANHAERSRHILESGDLDEALSAAAAVGDDRIQRQTQGYVVPDAFTHGSSAERARWFRAGFSGGAIDACDTFR